MTEWVSGNEVKPVLMMIWAGRCDWAPIPVHWRKARLQNPFMARNIEERHRHRYEVNIAYREKLEAAGLKMSGLSPDGLLPEIVEREDHPWFVAVQFHPELKSKPFSPHPLFVGFVAAARENHGLSKDRVSR